MRTSEVTGKYVRIVKDVYKDSRAETIEIKGKEFITEVIVH